MRFSIVIPLYNKAAHIRATLRSVAAQTCADYELVIVDDGSTDRSAAAAQAAAATMWPDGEGSAWRILRQLNGGVSTARNAGIAAAKGDFIALLDADDLWKPGFLAAISTLIDAYPSCNVFATNYETHDEQGRVSNTILRRLPFTGETGELTNYFEVAAHSHPPICSITVAFRKSAIDEIGGFPGGITSGEDLLTWARLACRNRIAYSTRPLAIFNVVGYNVSDRPKRLPQQPDIVGRELLELKKRFNPPRIREYLSHWHKMRASVYMRLGMRGRSIGESLRALRYNPLSYKLYAYLIINALPDRLKPF